MHIPKEIYNELLCCLPIACVDVLIVHNGRCLLLLRDNEPAKGQYWFPGGRIHKHETVANAVVRKAKEETNLDCKFEKIVSVEETVFKKNADMATDVHTINICCKVRLKEQGNDIRLDHLHCDFVWIDKILPHFHPGIKQPLKSIGFTE